MSRAPSLTQARAESVFDHLIANPDGLTLTDLATRLDCTYKQARDGIARLRDTLGVDAKALVYDTRGIGQGKRAGVYFFTLDADLIDRHRARIVRGAFTTMRRLYTGTLRPYLHSQPDAIARIVARQFERLLEDMDELISH